MKGLIHRLLKSEIEGLPLSRRAVHSYVVGQPGTGKSRALESWIMQDITSGHGVGVIDPHGDLFKNLLGRISSIPEVWRKVVIIDPCNPKWTVIFNPLEAIRDFSKERLALFMTDVVVKIWKLDTANSPRMIWLLTNSFLALSSLGLSLMDLPRFLLDSNYRENLLPRLEHEEALSYFLYEFPRSQGAIHQWVTPVLNKIGGLIFDPDIRLMLAGNSTINFRKIIDQKNILLVNLPKGIVGEGTSALMGAFFVAHIQKAALSRANTSHRNPYYLYLDEFQNYTTDNIKDILSESRKYAISLILAHQYLDQLSDDLQNAVLNTAGALACFRVGYQDAYRLAREIFPSPGFLTTTETGVKFDRFGNWSLLALEEKRNPMGWEGLAMALTQLPLREFWYRHRSSLNPSRYRTLDMPDVSLTPEVLTHLSELLDISGGKFGRLKQEVREGLLNTRNYYSSGQKKAYPEADPNGEDSLWAD